MAIRTTLLTGALLLLGGPVSLPAGMITIDFESLATSGTGFSPVTSPFADQGFTLTADNGFRAPQTESPQFFAGSTGLVTQGAESTVELVKTDSGLFDLVSIDFSEWPRAASGARSLTLTGITASGSVSQTVTLDGVFGFETFGLTGFNDLLSVSWTQNASEFVQFDNIVLSGPGVGGGAALAAPEPSSFGLLGVGLAVAGLGLRRRKSEQPG